MRLQKPFLPRSHPAALASVAAHTTSATNHSATVLSLPLSSLPLPLPLPPVVPAYTTPLSTHHYPFSTSTTTPSASSTNALSRLPLPPLSLSYAHLLHSQTQASISPMISPALSISSSPVTPSGSERDRESDDDYVNASYIQPLGTNKRYIATQGPLESTYSDFWA